VSEALLLGDRIGLMQEGRLLGIYQAQEFLESHEPSVKAYVDVFRSVQQLFRN
jgi:ABC-type proline/glycine betaine transport system ATPase subunit